MTRLRQELFRAIFQTLSVFVKRSFASEEGQPRVWWSLLHTRGERLSRRETNQESAADVFVGTQESAAASE